MYQPNFNAYFTDENDNKKCCRETIKCGKLKKKIYNIYINK